MPDIADLIMSRCDIGDCWEWRSPGPRGYGRVKRGGQQLQAHRYVYEHLVGNIPPGLTLDHLCRNRACVNPDHLEPVTLKENLRRGESFSAQNARKTHCHRGHPLSGENLGHQPKQRYCKACKRKASLRWYHKRQAKHTTEGGKDESIRRLLGLGALAIAQEFARGLDLPTVWGSS